MAKRGRGALSGGDRSAAPKRHSLVWLQGLLCGALATLATPTALLLGVLLGPALAVAFIDREPGKPIGRSVALFSMAGSVEPLKTLWFDGHTLDAAAALAGDMRIVGTAWSAAAAGWLLAQVLPIAARAVLDALAAVRAAQLRAERTRLVAEWGLVDQAEGEP